MTLAARVQGKRVYLDTNVFIYALEQVPLLADLLRGVFGAIDEQSTEAVTSELTLAECLVKPFQQDNIVHLNIYEHALRTRPGLEVLPISRQILNRAARLRAVHGMPLLDAIHAATAVWASCDLLLTNDGRLKNAGLEVLYLRDFAQG